MRIYRDGGSLQQLRSLLQLTNIFSVLFPVYFSPTVSAVEGKTEYRHQKKGVCFSFQARTNNQTAIYQFYSPGETQEEADSHYHVSFAEQTVCFNVKYFDK